MLTKVKMVYTVAIFLTAAVPAHAQGKTFSMPDSILLFLWSEIVMPNASEVIRIPAYPVVRTWPGGFPSLSTDGNLVSIAFPVANDASKTWGVRVAVAVYSRSEKQWRTYGDYGQVHYTAISPDGTKVAFLAEKADSESRELLLLDLRSGMITTLQKMIAVDVSWSPDGKKLALTIPYSGRPAKIAIYDFVSGTVSERFEGCFPAWSPTGEWIAYIDSSERKVRLVHPNGTSDHVLKDLRPRFLGWYRTFHDMPVWSPDGTKLLLNVYAGLDSNYHDVVLLDARTGKMTKKSHNGYLIWGWAPLPR